MSEILQTNIFLFITASAIILFVVVLIILFIYLISIFRDIKKISSRTQKQVNLIADDLEAARRGIKTEGRKILSILSVVSSIFSTSSKKKTKKKAKK